MSQRVKKKWGMKEKNDFLFRLYRFLFAAKDLTTWTKGRTLETAAADFADDHWRVVSISRDALLHIYQYRSAKGLRRGHAKKRHDRARRMFDQAKPISRNKFISWFLRRDTVTLVTKAENAEHGTKHWSKRYRVRKGHFKAGGGFAVRVRMRTELPWVKEKVMEHSLV